MIELGTAAFDEQKPPTEEQPNETPEPDFTFVS